MKKLIQFIIIILLLTGCSSTPQSAPPEQKLELIPTKTPETSLPASFIRRSTNPILDSISLPEGFVIDVFAEVDNARSMAVVESEESRTVFVGNRRGDSVYAVTDSDKDGYGDQVIEIASGLDMPNGVAYRNGDLYVAEKNRIHRFPDILTRLDDPFSEVVYDDLPDDDEHGWKYIAFGPDGLLYVPIGAPCNICDAGDPYASLTRIDLQTGTSEIVARGIRNTVGFDRDPLTGELWFTDNGRDRMGDDVPVDELNHITQLGQHFGYPYCHQGDVQDPQFDSRDCDEFVAPVVNLGPHVAALGMKFYDGKMFPDEYDNKILIAEHGSRNRSIATGYQLSIVDPLADTYKLFATGRNQDGTALGRPVDIVILDDGSILVSDDGADLIYRISYINQGL